MSASTSVVSVEAGGRMTRVRFTTAEVFQDGQAKEIGTALSACAEPHARVLLDFSDVRYLSSAVLASIVHGSRAITAAGGELRLCNLSPVVREEFGWTKLDSILRIFDSEDAAVAGW